MSKLTLKVIMLADTAAKRTAGLMHAEPLGSDEAAFFMFPTSDIYGFWNHNVSFPLDLAFVSDRGRIVSFASLEPGQTRVVYPRESAQYVIEAAKGVFGTSACTIGDIVRYSAGNLVIESSKTHFSPLPEAKRVGARNKHVEHA